MPNQLEVDIDATLAGKSHPKRVFVATAGTMAGKKSGNIAAGCGRSPPDPVPGVPKAARIVAARGAAARIAAAVKSECAGFIPATMWRQRLDALCGEDRTGRARPGGAGRLRWAVRALAMAASWLPYLPRILFSRRLRGAGERLRGAATLIRLRLLRSWWMLRQAAGATI